MIVGGFVRHEGGWLFSATAPIEEHILFHDWCGRKSIKLTNPKGERPSFEGVVLTDTIVYQVYRVTGDNDMMLIRISNQNDERAPVRLHRGCRWGWHDNHSIPIRTPPGWRFAPLPERVLNCRNCGRVAERWAPER